MKTKLLFGALVFVASAGWSFGQGSAQPAGNQPTGNNQGFAAPAGNTHVTLPAKPSPTPVITRGGRGGVIPTMLRHRNPLQMLNPVAPPQYGTAEEHTSYDPQNPGKPKGIKLFEWTF